MHNKNDILMVQHSPSWSPASRLMMLAACNQAMLQQVYQPLSFDAFLQVLARLVKETMGASSCILHLTSPRGRHIKACSSSELSMEPGTPIIDANAPVPLCMADTAGEMALQLQCRYAQVQEEMSETLCALLRACANQVAIILTLYQQREFLASESLLLEFFSILLRDPAAAKGWLVHKAPLLNMDIDLQMPHVFILSKLIDEEPAQISSLEMSHALKTRVMDLAREACKEYPGSLFSFQRIPYCFVGLIALSRDTDEEVKWWLLPRILALNTELGGQRRLCVGIGDIAREDAPTSYRESFEQAKAALEASLTHEIPLDVVSYHPDVEAQQLLQSQHSHPMMIDFDGLVEAIATYDRKNAPDLLFTLEMFLKCGMSATETARVLQIPHVSMRRRIERLQKLCDPYHLDLGKDSHLWFDGLYMAIKQYRHSSKKYGIL